MIDIAWSQFLIILILAVVLLGPKELPLLLRTLGKWFVILRTHLQDLQDYLKAVSQVDLPQQHNFSSKAPVTEEETSKQDIYPPSSSQNLVSHE
jgi:sec-independent protein translocase protein TatB